VTRLFAITLLLALPLAASAQPVMRKLAVLSPANAYNPVEVELDRRLAAAGWVAGKNFTRSTRRAMTSCRRSLPSWQASGPTLSWPSALRRASRRGPRPPRSR
jgi:hypothetical protein